MKRVLLLLAACLSIASCRTRDCKSGTLLLTLDYGTLPGDLDVALSLAYPGEAPTTSHLARTGTKATGSVEIDFASGYHAGQILDVAVVATSGGAVVGQATTSFALTPGCAALTLEVAPGEGPDASAGTGDASSPVDMSHGPEDLAGLVFPSNVMSTFLDESHVDWTLSASTTIDTSQDDAADAIVPTPPTGVVYMVEGSVVVLAVHDLTVPSNMAITITGTRPLVIVAGGSITVSGLIDASAHGATPGPGGSTPGAGTGMGGNGFNTNGGTVRVSGGAGGSFGTSGGAGGPGDTLFGGMIKSVYGVDALIPPYVGSGGGGGGSFSCMPSNATGGASGGFLQLSARTSIVVGSVGSIGATPNGVIAVAGGGGGTCASGVGGGGGGGSGGGLLVESPVVNVMGLLDTAGGGGGSQTTAGNDGIVYVPTAASSAGGAEAASASSAGGAGSNQVTAKASAQTGGTGVGAPSTGSPVGGGGGGGGSGRLHVRSNGTATLTSTTTTPTLDETLPDAIP